MLAVRHPGTSIVVCMCVPGWWWTTGPISWLSGWVGRSSWCPLMCLDWFMVRLSFGQGLYFALCCLSSTPSSLSSSSTARRWKCHFNTGFIQTVNLLAWGEKKSWTNCFSAPTLISVISFLFRSRCSITVGLHWRRFAPPPPHSFSWWFFCLAWVWPP